jgi:hypothetical protein
MIFYCHDLHEKENVFSWHRQNTKAMTSARAHAKVVPRGQFVEVEKVTFVDLPAKELLLAVLNGSGYVSERETVAEVKGKLKPQKPTRAKPEKEGKKEKAELQW